ncbi:anti-sigma factor [Agromyces sp. NPDC058110]|uniref:anti-sigma factor n=1 Tax=Agromyces sp. NPDC058110 TaxID=3346345 RepID=UPI0036DB3CE7
MHPNPEDLAAIAADGAAPDNATAEHLASCDPCRSEYESYLTAAAAGRSSVTTELDLESPPSSVWAGIHAELGLDESLRPDPVNALEAAPSRPEHAQPLRPATAGVVAERSRTGVRRWWPAIAAAAAVIGLVAGIAIGANVMGSTTPGSERVVAEARLEPFPGWNADGRAFLEQDDDGRYSMLVELDGAVDVDGLTEVWLLREEPIGLVSLGLLDGTSARFALPDDLDVSEFSVVDLSAEQPDGDPAHSGDSIVRGQLRRLQ